MKRIITALFAALLLCGSVVLTACGSGSETAETTASQTDPQKAGESSENGAQRPTSAAPNTFSSDSKEKSTTSEEIPEELKPIAGIWKLTKISIGGQELDPAESATTYEFHGDRTFRMEMMGETVGEGTYEFSENTVTIDLDGSKTGLTLSGGELTLEIETMDGISVQVFRRA